MLSENKAKAAKSRQKAYKLSDSARLYLFITPSGGNLWRWNYVYDGKQKSMAFGPFPRVSLAEAREKRDAAHKLVSEGRDPNVAKKLQLVDAIDAGRNTFEQIARTWHANAKPQWAGVHADDVIRSLERDVFPIIGALPISDLTPPHILGVLEAIQKGGAIETAKRVRQRISATFVYAIAKGITHADPAEKLGAVLKPICRGRQPAITDLVPLQKMIRAAEDDPARPITRLALRMLALTAVRPSELRGARWAELEDLNGKEPVWRIPAVRRKGISIARPARRRSSGTADLAGHCGTPDSLGADRQWRFALPTYATSAPADERKCDWLFAQPRGLSRPSCAAWVPGRVFDHHERIGRARGQEARPDDHRRYARTRAEGQGGGSL